MTPSTNLFVGIVVFVFGACIGSFLNVCIFRLPAGRSIVRPGSSCPKCGHRLSWWENIPILSYLILRAKCHRCQAPISVQYPLVEALTGTLTLALWQKFGPTPQFMIYFPFIASLLVISFIDLEYQVIPDTLSLPGILLGIACSFLNPDLKWYDSIIGAILGGGVLFSIAAGYLLLTKKEGMGGGDIKLLAMIGAYLGWRALPLVIFISAAAGSVIGIGIILLSKAGRQSPIPFGPFLSAAAVLTLFYGDQIWAWYLGLLTQPNYGGN